MRLSRPRLIGLVIGAVVFGVIIAFQALGTDDDGPPDDATTTPVAVATSPATPAAGPTATPAIGAPFSGPIDDGFVRLDLAQGEVPDRPHGIVFVDAETGAGEFWHVPAAQNTQGENYGTDESHRWLQLLGIPDDRLLVADRQTGETFALDTTRWTTIAGPSPRGIVVIQANVERDYLIVDLATDPTALSLRLDLPKAHATNRIALLDDGAALVIGPYLVSLADGVTEMDPVTLAFLVSYAAADGGWLDVRLTDNGTVAQRFDASGQPMDINANPQLTLLPSLDSYRGTPPPPPISANGRWFVWGAFVDLASPAMTEVWPAFTLEDLQEEETVLRAVRASTLRGGAWLADSSGVVVATPDGFSILRTDGSLTPLPFGPVEQSGVGGVPVPIPAPHDAGLFLYNGEVISADGVVLSPAFASADWASLVPWNEHGFSPDGTELRFVQSPPPGRDYGLPVLTAFGLPARIEFPPFDDQLLLQVNSPDGLNLRAQPDEDSEVISTLPDGAVVTVTDSPDRMSSAWWEEADADPDTPWWVFDARWWVHVRTANGEQGWVSTEFVTWAE